MNAPSDGPTKEELYERAQELDIQGRSDMDKEELAAAIAEEEDGTPEGAVRSTPTAPPPAAADQPGVGRAANPESSGQPLVNRSASRIGAKVNQARQSRRERRAESA